MNQLNSNSKNAGLQAANLIPKMDTSLYPYTDLIDDWQFHVENGYKKSFRQYLEVRVVNKRGIYGFSRIEDSQFWVTELIEILVWMSKNYENHVLSSQTGHAPTIFPLRTKNDEALNLAQKSKDFLSPKNLDRIGYALGFSADLGLVLEDYYNDICLEGSCDSSKLKQKVIDRYISGGFEDIHDNPIAAESCIDELSNILLVYDTMNHKYDGWCSIFMQQRMMEEKVIPCKIATTF